MKKSRKSYVSNDQMIRDYQEGRLAGFLASDAMVGLLVQNKKISPPPIILKKIETLALKHYLAAEHAPFMKRFSAYLAKNKPFGDFIPKP